MNDETHDGGGGGELAASVLRPFTATDQEPLPPVEPSKVLPEPPSATADASIDESVPPPPPVDALTDDPWSPDADDTLEYDDEDEGDADDAGDDDDMITAEALGFDGLVIDEGEDAFVASESSPTITLPRKPFLIGLGVLLAAVALFAALWQTAGDDGGADVAAPTGDAAVPAEPGEGQADAGDGSGVSDADAPVVDSSMADDLAAAQAEIAGLEAAVDALEERPPPALDGSTLRRIVVGADAKFVSALPESVAVVGAFGGVSLIDPETNRVVANGNVADAATRVMRTSSSVWLTNYADNQILRVDPATNTVAATFPFEGPDGIDKDGDTIVVASFDGEFVARVNPNNGQTLQQVDVGGTPTEVISHSAAGLWAAVFDTGEIVQIDRESFEVVQRVTVGSGPVGLFASAKYLWVANHDEGTIVKVAVDTGEIEFTTRVGDGPTELVLANGSVWVTVTDDGSLVQVSGADGSIVSRTPLGGASAGGGPTGLSFANGTLWVAMQGEQSVVRVDLP
jgi:hypothetical protein